MKRVRDTQITVGLPLLNKPEAPKIFLSRLKETFQKTGYARTVPFFFPWFDIALFNSHAHFCYSKPYVLRVDGIAFDREETRGPNRKINQPIFESIFKSAGVIYQSSFNKRLVEKFLEAKKKPNVVIPNGICLERFSPDGEDKRKELDIPKHHKVIITSASWRAHKRLKDVIEIFFKASRMSREDLHLIILGKGADEAPDHPRIHCPGFIAPSLLPAWYRSADLFVFLSWLDSCPNALIEAIACGLPAICSNQGGSREIVERASGGFVVNVDPPFEYDYVDLYRPPSLNQNKIVSKLLHMLDNLDYFRRAIDRSVLDIRNVAKKYRDFLKECLVRKSE